MKLVIYILLLFIPAGLMIAYDIYFNLIKKGNKHKLTIVKFIFKDLFIVDLFSVAIMAKVFNFKNVISPEHNSYLFLLVLFLTTILVSVSYLLIKKFVYTHYIIERQTFKNRIGTAINYILAVILVFSGLSILFGSIWSISTYGKMSFDQVMLTLFTPITGTDFKIICSCVDNTLIPVLSLTYLFALVFFFLIANNIKTNKKKNAIFGKVFMALAPIFSGLIIMISGSATMAYQLDLPAFIKASSKQSSYIDENYIDPGNVNIKVPGEKRNLIHIYLESIENSYFDKNNGGNLTENLMPELLKLTERGVSFSHKSTPNGGPLTTYGATWSVASMVNQFFGVPMKASFRNNSYGSKDNFYPGAVGIGDIFKKLDYNQTLMLGADADFGGLSYMFGDHGDFKIMDYKYALKNNMIPAGYKVNWGYEDEKLYEFAKEELTRLGNSQKPFYFVMENADTHFPGLSFDGDKPINNAWFGNDYAKTIKYSDYHVARFVEWICNQPFFKNTTIVLIGDHLSMDYEFFRANDFKNYERTTFNLIINPASSIDLTNDKIFYNRKWASFDMMPTLLAALGFEIEGNRLGLGTNLFSENKTVFEADGYEYVNELFKQKSIFYNDVLLHGKIDYNGTNLLNKSRRR